MRFAAYPLQKCTMVDPGAEVGVYQLDVTAERETKRNFEHITRKGGKAKAWNLAETYVKSREGG
jgi:hypothetical protein